ncbi:putative phage associated protein [Corynebacterium deserti GIMN1.010]|uniref:Putative phage associated protein n=1 Tax=Corynebacterium deserti GIMN1.010 TaxID=931089 RepID=A0A0M4CG76_9CORY|nr:terminase large subunit [Corynebacterium deserti]ALC05927.1 putative phage associated protein [Corynebacterium deserti GIMN1.010]
MTTMTTTKREDYPTSEDFPTLTGKQTPLNLREAPGDHEHGRKNIELARRAGVPPMPWQCNEINAINATNPDGTWTHSDAILIVPRQNGKSLIVALIVIYRIFILGQNVLFTAQQWETAKELYEQAWKIVKGRRFLMKLVTSHTCSQGRGTIFLSNGGRVVFTTRSQDAGRGLTKVDLLIYDEAYNLTDGEMAALSFLSQAAPDPQVFFMSSSVHKDFPQHQKGKVLSAMRAQALDDFDINDPLYLSEYAAPTDLDPEDEQTWILSNPSYGVIATAKKMKKIMRRMNTEEGRINFGVEALGWASWFDELTEDNFTPVISDEALTAVMTTNPQTLSHSVISIDAAPDRTMCSISIGGRSGEKVYGRVVYHADMNVKTVVDATIQVIEAANPMAILIDHKSPAEVLIDPLERAGFDVERMTFTSVKSSTAAFLQGVDDQDYLLDDSQIIRDGMACAELREDKDGGVKWARRSGVICQLVSLSAAMWGVTRFAPLPAKRKAPVLLPVEVESVEIVNDFAF